MTEQSIIPLMAKPNRIRTQVNTQESFIHIIEVYEPLETPADWSDELNIINSAGESDTIVLDLCTPGGCGDTAFLFHRALKNTAAHTVALIGPQCSSAGSILALSCREHVLDDTSELMCHTSQFAIGGKEVDVFEHVTFSRRRLEKLFKLVYSGFATDSEIAAMIDGRPMYFDGEDLAKRLENLYDYWDEQDQGCGDENCVSCGDQGEPPQTLDSIIESAVEKGVEVGVNKVLDQLKKKYNLVEKQVKKPSAKTAKALEQATEIAKNVNDFNSGEFLVK